MYLFWRSSASADGWLYFWLGNSHRGRSVSLAQVFVGLARLYRNVVVQSSILGDCRFAQYPEAGSMPALSYLQQTEVVGR